MLNDSLAEQEKRMRKEMADICNNIVHKKIDDLEKKYKRQFESQKILIDELQLTNKQLNEKVVVLEKDSSIAFKEIEDTQRLAYQTDQYQRRMNVEISGIPHDCDDQLEEVVIDLVNRMRKEPGDYYEDDEYDIGEFDIQGCHRLQSKNKEGVKNTIVRFNNRKICDEIHDYKKNVKDVKSDKLGKRVKNSYFNDNLSKYNKDFAAKCRRLKKNKQIQAMQVRMHNEFPKSLFVN